MSQPYDTLPGMDAVYLEDSYVLDIAQDDHELRFDLELVLTPNHPEYRPPGRDEAHCYRRATLTFTGYREAVWADRTGAVFTDATGETDRGNIDTFTAEDDTYRLSGDWGAVTIHGGRYELRLTDAR